MKARVTVSFKKSILDPQGQTIRSALSGRGYEGILDVRQGKVFEIEIAGDLDREQARRNLEEIARDILANPVIEDYRVELAD
jgi:phosphoribosylformylglycinamidine synthase